MTAEQKNTLLEILEKSLLLAEEIEYVLQNCREFSYDSIRTLCNTAITH